MNRPHNQHSATNSSPVMKVALPTCLSARAVETIYDLTLQRIQKRDGFRLLLDMSEVHQIEQEGLTKLYEMTLLMKDSGYSKVVIRMPHRVVRDALILSNTASLFEITENE